MPRPDQPETAGKIVDVRGWIQRLSTSPKPLLKRVFGFHDEIFLADESVVLEIIRRVKEQCLRDDDQARLCSPRETAIGPFARSSLASFRAIEELEKTCLPLWTRLLKWICFAALIVAYLPIITLRTILMRVSRQAPLGEPAILSMANPGLAEETVREQFEGKPVSKVVSEPRYLGLREWRFLLRACMEAPGLLVRPMLMANILRWLAVYGYLTRFRSPMAIVVTAERVVSMPLMTCFVRQLGITHVNVMHGERLLTADGSFAVFDMNLVWGEHFRKLMLRQECPDYQFSITGCPRHRHLFFGVRSQLPIPGRILVLFIPEMRPGTAAFRSFLDFAACLSPDWEVVVRPHPRYGQLLGQFMESVLADNRSQRTGFKLSSENPLEVDPVRSLGQSSLAVSLLSSMMLEAWIAGRRVVYLDGGGNRQAVMARHGDSKRVIHMRDVRGQEHLKSFLTGEVEADQREVDLINFVTSLKSSSAKCPILKPLP